jgi:single stranded DNA-binding protein
MPESNRIELTGYLASKPEARTLPSGTPVANVRIGQSYLYDTKEGAKRHTNWFTLAFYGEMAQIAVSLEEGDHVNVVGTVQQREFTPKDGSARKVYEVVVKKCHLVDRPHASSQIENRARSEETAARNDSSPILASTQEELDAWAIL